MLDASVLEEESDSGGEVEGSGAVTTAAVAGTQSGACIGHLWVVAGRVLGRVWRKLQLLWCNY